MSIEQTQERIQARVVQAFHQSDVDLSKLTSSEQQRLVAAIVDGVLREFNALLDDLAPAVQPYTPAEGAATPDPEPMTSTQEEQVIWEGRPFLSLTEHYVLTTERIRIFRGFLSKSSENIELVRLQDVDYRQHVGERMLNIGDVVLHSADPSDPEAVLRNIADPEQVQELIRQQWLDARRRYGVAFREQM